ncbi:MAG TPA: hypothetical protein P5234_00160 [Thermoanaerobaculaceae bacterium]|nr:hypothetical protein [Thermoanaerobaculaceae bacterium]HRS14642.1 hypothetical protein [Thermoanaerobaculaceae bacterium]
MGEGPGTIEQVLQESSPQLAFLTPREIAGAWPRVFDEAASRMPQPYWLFAEDEQRPIGLGFPHATTGEWEVFCRELGRLIDAEAANRRALSANQQLDKSGLVELRRAVAGRIADFLENAILHDYGQRLPEIFWLALTAEIGDRVHAATLAEQAAFPQIGQRNLDELRYQLAQRLAEVAHRGETEACSRVRRSEGLEMPAASRAFARLLREDLLPFAESHVGCDVRRTNSFLHGFLRVDAGWARRLLHALNQQILALREKDPGFDQVLTALDPEAPLLPRERLFLCRAVHDLLPLWPHPDTPHPPPELRTIVQELAVRCRRYEVISALRRRVIPVETRAGRVSARFQGRVVQLSAFTRPLSFTTVGVVPSVVQRYGLVYDLVEFTQILEALRRRGRATEEGAMRQMVRFLGQVDALRGRFRLKFEKFLGDGAFYSGRSARSLLEMASELRLLYERLRRQGFPFDRGMRIAVNIGSYHLLPMVSATAERPQYEFFGHGIVELGRLTSGKRTHEVEDIADFLIASGYDVHEVLKFLEPVRTSSRAPEGVRDRPYAAYIAENGELVNQGTVLTEEFVRALDVELGPQQLFLTHAFNTAWVVLAPGDPSGIQPWHGLRPLGVARLKGLDAMPLVEAITFESAPGELEPLPEGLALLPAVQQQGGEGGAAPLETAASAAVVDPRLCVVGVLDEASKWVWYIGLFQEEMGALDHAFRVGLNPVGLNEGDSPEVWLFQRRGELAMLYQGLRRDSEGVLMPLETLRGRDGYFACLLAAPHRSPS